MKEVNMLEPMHIFDERVTTDILTEEMHSLYLFSFLLTADNDIAEQCYVCGLGEWVEGISAFMDWVHSWARRTILKHAIRMIMPAPEHTGNLSLISLKSAARLAKNNLFAAIVTLSAFERFVFVMSVLEKQSDEDCSMLLGCSRRDVMIARELALKRLADTDDGYDQSVWAARSFASDGLLA
jgi:DNA-directed RNA polymerase specialized sigma24 family protein